MAKRKSVSFLKFFEDQDLFAEAVFSGLYKYLLYGGSVRSGKTIACLGLIVVLAKVFPGSKWGVIRKDVPTLKKTSIPTFFKYCCPSNFYLNKSIKDAYNKTDRVFTAENGSQIIFFPENFSQDPDLDWMKGLEVNGWVLEQIEELKKVTFDTAIQRYGQWRLNPMPPKLILATCNPTNYWPKATFYDKWKAGKLKKPFYFQLADIFKNPHLDKDYLESLKDMPKEFYDVFVANQWEAVDAIDQLVPWEAIRNCKEHIIDGDNRRWLGVDVGRNGPDPSVFFLMKGSNIEKIEAYPKTKINEVDEKIERMIVEYKLSPSDICVDSVGLGAGVIDNLEKRGHYVIPMVGGAKEIVRNKKVGTHFGFFNWKAWSYWLAAEELKTGRVGNFSNDILQSEAGAIKYTINNDKEIRVQSKEGLKKTLGRSCDYWDAYSYAIWAKLNSQVTQGSLESMLYTGAMMNKDKAHEEALEINKTEYATEEDLEYVSD